MRKMARSADGAAICYSTFGDGRPLVLLHGFTDRIESWAETGYLEPLTAGGHRLIMIDQRGHGGSSRPHEARAYAANLRADDVVAVLEDLAIARADVLGYSMGGWVALNIARYYPDRMGCLIVGGAHSFAQSMTFYREAVAADFTNWIGIVEKLGGPMTDAWKARIRASDIVALRAAVAEDRPDISAELAGFDHPCLCYAGSEDPLQAQVARCAELLPRGRYFEVPGCNHVTALLRVDLIMPELLAFLSSADRPIPAQ